MRKVNGKEKSKSVKKVCKMIKTDIFKMISSLSLDDIELLHEIESGIINAHADYYYSKLVAEGLIDELEDPIEEYSKETDEEYFKYLFKYCDEYLQDEYDGRIYV